MDKEKKKITLKNADGKKLLYPRTAASHVEVTSNGTMLDQYLKGMVETVDNSKNLMIVKEAKKVSNTLKLKDASGTEKKFDGSAEIDLSTTGVYYAATAGSATNADNAGKLEGSTKEQILQEADTAAGVAAGNALTSANAYTDNAIKDVTGAATVLATTVEYGKVRLATVDDMSNSVIVDDEGYDTNPYAVAVSPYVLKRYVEGFPTLEDVAEEVAKIVDNAPEAYDTLKEIADYIASDKTNAANMNNAISANTTEITKIKDGTTTVGKATSATTAGSATTATTATNLSSAPSLGTSGNTITVTAGGKTSAAITVPYATSAGSATSATSATTATNLSSAPVLANGTTDSNKIKITAGGKTSSEFTVPYSTKAGSATSATTAEKATKDSNGNTINFSKDGVETLLNLTYDGGTEDVTY